MKASIVTLVVLLCLAPYLYPGCKIVWQFDHLESNAKKLITAALRLGGLA